MLRKKDGFKQIARIGEGVAGDVYACQYTGAQPEIKALTTKDGIIIVKIPKEDPMSVNPIDNEKEMITHLNSAIKNDEKKETQYTRSAVVNVNGQEIVMSEIIYFGNENNKLQISNLEEFIKGIVENEYGNQDLGLLKTALSLILNGFALSMWNSLNELNKAGLFHLDCLPRNFLVICPIISASDEVQFAVKITDYGLSAQISEQENAQLKLPGGLLKPLECWNNAAIPAAKNNYHFDIRTDLFMLKVGMMQMLGFMLGQSNREMMQLNGIDPSHHEYMNIKRSMSDEAVLMQYLENLKSGAAKVNDQYLERISHYVSNNEKRLEQNKNLSAINEKLKEDKITALSNNEFAAAKLIDENIKINTTTINDNKTTISIQIDAINDNIELMKVSTIRGEVVQSFINTHSQYLTAMPKGEKLQEKCEDDKKMLDEAAVKFTNNLDTYHADEVLEMIIPKGKTIKLTNKELDHADSDSDLDEDEDEDSYIDIAARAGESNLEHGTGYSHDTEESSDTDEAKEESSSVQAVDARHVHDMTAKLHLNLTNNMNEAKEALRQSIDHPKTENSIQTNDTKINQAIHTTKDEENAQKDVRDNLSRKY